MSSGLFVVVFALIITTSAWLWHGHGRRLFQNQAYLDFEVPRNRPFGMVDVAIMFFTWALVSMAALHIGSALGWLPAPGTIDELAELTFEEQTSISLAQGLGVLVGTIISMIIVRLRYRSESNLFGLGFEGLNRKLLLAFAAFVMVFPFLFGIQFLCGLIQEYKHDTLELLKENFSIPTILATWFTAVVVAPIAEEVFFRGLLQAWLQRFLDSPDPGFDVPVMIGGWGVKSSHDLPNSFALSSKLPPRARTVIFWLPIVISAFLFGMAHFGQGLAPIPLFVFAIALGYLYRTTGSLIPCIVVHMLLNGYTMFWLTLQLLEG